MFSKMTKMLTKQVAVLIFYLALVTGRSGGRGGRGGGGRAGGARGGARGGVRGAFSRYSSGTLGGYSFVNQSILLLQLINQDRAVNRTTLHHDVLHGRLRRVSVDGQDRLFMRLRRVWQLEDI